MGTALEIRNPLVFTVAAADPKVTLLVVPLDEDTCTPWTEKVAPMFPPKLIGPVVPEVRLRTFVLAADCPSMVLLKEIAAPVAEPFALVVSILTGTGPLGNVHGPPITTGPLD
jgi:hypothetical protein